jgi:hypothetical protein
MSETEHLSSVVQAAEETQAAKPEADEVVDVSATPELLVLDKSEVQPTEETKAVDPVAAERIDVSSIKETSALQTAAPELSVLDKQLKDISGTLDGLSEKVGTIFDILSKAKLQTREEYGEACEEIHQAYTQMHPVLSHFALKYGQMTRSATVSVPLKFPGLPEKYKLDTAGTSATAGRAQQASAVHHLQQAKRVRVDYPGYRRA